MVNLSIVIALIIFSVLVIFHEFGHFIVAKKNGIVVNEFSLGMGPRLISWGKGETKYSIKILPFGGSCAMLGEDQDTVVEGSFNSKSVWARMAVVFAGPFFNFILAWVLALIVIGFEGIDLAYVDDLDTQGILYEKGLRDGDKLIKVDGKSAVIARELFRNDYLSPLDGSEIELVYKRDGKKHTIKYVPPGEKKYLLGMSYAGTEDPAEVVVMRESSLAKAGAVSGDTIVSVNGTKINSGADLNKYFQENTLDGSAVKLTVLRNKKEIELEVEPKVTTLYNYGFKYTAKRIKQSPIGVVRYSFNEVKYDADTVLKSLKLLVTGKVNKDEMSGPVGIVGAIGDTYESAKKEGIMLTIMTMLNMAIMLSANLGVMNLLPIPALDGGRLLFFIIEALRGKPIDREKEGMIHFVGFVLLMIFMVFLIFNDVGKLF